MINNQLEFMPTGSRIVLLSQRVDWDNAYRERRDALDQRWAELLYHCGLLALPVANHADILPELLNRVKPDGILLTGGNNPLAYGGEALERDQTDKGLITYACQHKLPLLGVCRGMQSIALHFGGVLEAVGQHRAVRHMVHGKINREVNSYHTWGMRQINGEFDILASSDDGVIEAISHRFLPIYGMMWHPEREEIFDLEDLTWIRKVYCGGEA